MSDLFDLTGKNAMVVGGAGGLGQAMAQGLMEAGAEVAISSRNEESLQRAVGELKEATGKDAKYYVCDATDEEAVEAMTEQAFADYGKIDILICSQGFNRKYEAVDFPMDVWDELYQVNVKSVMMCNKHFGKRMKENGYGKIIDVSSIRGCISTFPMKGNAGYCSTKGAVDMIVRTCAAELGPEVTVNAIAPNVTMTPMMAGIVPPSDQESLAKGVPLQRLEVPRDCAGPAIFLASEASSFVTGQILYVDGGQTAIG